MSDGDLNFLVRNTNKSAPEIQVEIIVQLTEFKEQNDKMNTNLIQLFLS